MTRHRTIIQRKPIFLGCEGESERGYGALLNRYARDLPGVHLHIHVEVLQPGAGDPHALIQRAVQKISDLERRREAFVHKAVLLDPGQPDKNQAAERLAAQENIGHLIWQHPDHEAFLLRHLDGCQQLRPPLGTTLGALQQRWPDYRKASTQVQLAQRIAMPHIERVCAVEPDLRTFLLALGIIRADG